SPPFHGGEIPPNRNSRIEPLNLARESKYGDRQDACPTVHGEGDGTLPDCSNASRNFVFSTKQVQRPKVPPPTIWHDLARLGTTTIGNQRLARSEKRGCGAIFGGRW